MHNHTTSKKEEEFRKLTKKQKLEMPYTSVMHVICSTILFIPIKRKNDGYGMSACFIKTDGVWTRVADYDCFRFIELKRLFKGDFEYGGVCFFGEGNFMYDYGNEFTQI